MAILITKTAQVAASYMTLGVVILIALGGALAFEGFVWAVFPAQMRRAYEQSLKMADDKSLHITGLMCVAIGVVLMGIAVKISG